MLYILSFIICIVSGIVCYNWLEPESFGQVLVFLFAWAILTTVGYWILEMIYRLLNE